MSEEVAHEVVVSSLMDLQARLRGEAGDEPAATTAVETEESADIVRIPEAEPFFVASETPSEPIQELPPAPVPMVEESMVIIAEDHGAPVTPLRPADADLAATRLAALTERLAQLETDLEGVLTRIGDVTPERIERLESVHDELGAQEEDLRTMIVSHFTELQRSIDEKLTDSDN